MLRKGVLAMLPGPTMRLPSLTRLGSQPPLALVTQRRHVKVDLTRLSESNLERKTRGAITPRRAHIHFQQVFTKLFMAGELPEAWLEHLPPDLSRSSIHIKFLRQASMATWRTLPDEEKEKYIQAYEARKHNVEAYVPQKPGPPPLLTRHMDYWWYEQEKKEAAAAGDSRIIKTPGARWTRLSTKVQAEWRRKFALYFVEARKAVMDWARENQEDIRRVKQLEMKYKPPSRSLFMRQCKASDDPEMRRLVRRPEAKPNDEGKDAYYTRCREMQPAQLAAFERTYKRHRAHLENELKRAAFMAGLSNIVGLKMRTTPVVARELQAMHQQGQSPEEAAAASQAARAPAASQR